jgi:hypothetical protein
VSSKENPLDRFLEVRGGETDCPINSDFLIRAVLRNLHDVCINAKSKQSAGERVDTEPVWWLGSVLDHHSDAGASSNLSRRASQSPGQIAQLTKGLRQPLRMRPDRENLISSDRQNDPQLHRAKLYYGSQHPRARRAHFSSTNDL